jgi:hypothetical protein
MAIITSASMMVTWEARSQLRRRPSQRVKKGSGMRSTNGDHTHLKPYASPTQLKNPIVVRSIPASRSQKLSVPNTNNKGSPAENPRDSMRKEAGSKYTLNVARHVGLSAVDTVLGVKSDIKE